MQKELSFDLRDLITRGWFNLLLLVTVLGLQLLEPLSGEWLGFQREEILEGQYWRVFTGQLVHTNLNHALLNASGLFLMMVSFQYEQRAGRDITCFMLCALFVGVGILLLVPNIGWYKGLSGILHGYFIYYIFVAILTTPRIALIALAVITGKLVWEQSPLADLSATESLIDSRVAVESHLLGAIAGYLYGAFTFWKLKQKAQATEQE